MTWQFVLAGALVGVLVGMTGMGGGSLMTPILILAFGFDAKVAVGTDLLHGAIFKSFGAARHRMLGTVHARLALWMLLGSAPLSLVGVQIASGFSEGTNSTMQKIVGAALILGGLGFAVKSSSQAAPTTRRSCSRRATSLRRSRSAPSAASSSGSPRSVRERSSGSRCCLSFR